MPGSKVSEEVSIYKSTGSNTVVSECIYHELLARVVRCVRLDIVLVGKILVCPPQCASLTDFTS